MPADGNITYLRPPLRIVETAPAGAFNFDRREPEALFEVNRRCGWVVWAANGLRIVHEPQFRALADLFAENGWIRHFNALLDAELALSAVDPAEEVRRMLAASVADLGREPPHAA